jgi:DNA-binding winged helix-turn-helix (wHTH) protein
MARDEIYEFGGFTLDVHERRVSDGRRPIALAPKAFDLLVALIRRAGHLTSKQDLLERVWAEAYVEEGILAVHVSALRKALRDTQRPARFIETVPRSGYRFVAPITRRTSVAATAPALPNDRPPEPPSSRTWRSLLDVLPPRPLAPAGAVGAASAARSTPEVYELCAIGREHLLAASMFEVPRAVEAFRAAIAIDASYGPAHAGLALAHCAQAAMRVASPADAYRDARSAALRALAIDPDSDDAQVALGTVLFLGEWDWDGAERSLRRALEINPAHVQGYVIYGRLLDALGRSHEAMDIKLRAFERDPLSPIALVQLALTCWNQRRYDDAIEWANKALRIDPRHLLAREFLAGAYFQKQDFEKYLAASIEHAAIAGASADALRPIEDAYRADGWNGVVRSMLQLVESHPRTPPFQLALLCSLAGDVDAAFLHLDRALDAHDPSLVDLAVSPLWDRLRADPRFESRVARLRVPVRPESREDEVNEDS